MILTHRKATPTVPTIHLGDVAITPQPSVKWLGAIIDLKLTFTSHIKYQTAKGLKAANRLSALARTGWGIPLMLCKRLTFSFIFSSTNYASMVLHKPDLEATRTAALQRVDNVAHRFALGSFRTHPLEFLLHDTNSLSARDRLNNKTDIVIARLLTLLDTNTAGVPVLRAFSKN